MPMSCQGVAHQPGPAPSGGPCSRGCGHVVQKAAPAGIWVTDHGHQPPQRQHVRCHPGSGSRFFPFSLPYLFCFPNKQVLLG